MKVTVPNDIKKKGVKKKDRKYRLSRKHSIIQTGGDGLNLVTSVSPGKIGFKERTYSV